MRAPAPQLLVFSRPQVRDTQSITEGGGGQGELGMEGGQQTIHGSGGYIWGYKTASLWTMVAILVQCSLAGGVHTIHTCADVPLLLRTERTYP